MQTIFYLLWPVLAALIALGTWASQEGVSAETAATRPQTHSFERQLMPEGVLYTFRLPADSPLQARVAISDARETVTGFYQRLDQPLLVLNAGFFDPSNHLTTSYVSVEGKLVADPALNENLTGNANLQKYLPAIYNRTEFRIYNCGKAIRYDIASHEAETPAGCTLRDAVGGGPALLPDITAEKEAFTDYDAAGRMIRDPIGACKPNARTALGLTPEGDLILLMGGMHPERAGSGFTLEDMARLLKARGVVKGMALDGGGSSSLVYQGEAYWGKYDKSGKPEKRPVKSILLIRGP